MALLMAGLPFRVSNLLRNQSASFLRRANQYHLHPIETCEVREALIETVKDSGKASRQNIKICFHISEKTA